MIKTNSLIFFILAFLTLFSVRLGAGSSLFPEGDKVKTVGHGVELPVGFSIPPSDYAAPSISTDYGNKYGNPAKFELPTKIMTKGLLPKERMISFLWLKNSRMDVVDIELIADLYIKEAAKEGVNHDIAFAQMMLETGYLKFTGDVSKLQNNFCGLGAIGEGVPGLSFNTVEEGVRAHIQHLKAYASMDSLNHKKVDDRYGKIKRGIAPEIRHLTGRWATDPLYDQKIVQLISLIYAGYVPPKKSTFVLFD